MKVNKEFAPVTITFETKEEWEHFKEFLELADMYINEGIFQYSYSRYTSTREKCIDISQRLTHFKQLIK